MTDCYICKDRIKDGDWAIPLDTYRARYRGDELVLDADDTLETIVHAECLADSSQTRSDSSGDGDD